MSCHEKRLGQSASVLAEEAERNGERTHQNETEGPNGIEIEPASRHELKTEVTVDCPCKGSTGSDHRSAVNERDQNSHAQAAADEGAGCLVAAIEVDGLAEPEINRHQHKSRSMSNCHGE